MIFIQDNQNQLITYDAIGAKAKGLFVVQPHGASVPHWVVLPADFTAEAFKDLTSISRTEDLLHAIDHYAFPSSLATELDVFFPENTHFSVRASPNLEAEHASYLSAQFPSFLSVRREDVWQKIKTIWRSVFSKEVLSYRTANRLSPMLGVAVIIQETLDAQASGTAYGLNPNTGNRKEKLVSAAFGLGGVQKQADADTYLLTSGRIDRQIFRKRDKRVLDVNGSDGVSTAEVLRIHQHDQAVADEHIHMLAKLLDDLRSVQQQFYQLDFAIADDHLYILQADPIPNLEQLPDRSAAIISWNRKRFSDSFSGVIPPLLFSCVRSFAVANAKWQARFFGASAPDIDKHEETFSRIIGIIDGRLYENLSASEEIARMLPGHRVDIHFQPTVGTDDQLPDRTIKRYDIPANKAWKRVLAVSFQLFRAYKKLDKESIEYAKYITRVQRRYERVSWQDKNPQELMQLYFKLERNLWGAWSTPQKAAFYFNTLFHWLRKETQAITPERGDTIGNRHDLASALLLNTALLKNRQPLERRLEIAQKIRTSAVLYPIFQQEQEKEVWHFIQNDHRPETVNLRHVLEDYLIILDDQHRPASLIDSSQTDQQGIHLVGVLQFYLRSDLYNLDQAIQVEQKLRQDAEQIMDQALRRKYIRRWWYNKLLRRTRDLLRVHQDFEYDQSRLWIILKALYSAMGKRFAEEGLIEFSGDIFFLSKEEIFSFIDGRSITTDLKALVAVRKEEHERFMRQPEPGTQIHTSGMPYRSNNFSEGTAARSQQDAVFSGAVSCPGKVVGNVRLMAEGAWHQLSRDISDLATETSVNDQIFVLRGEDVPLTHVLPYAKAIVVETSHVWSPLSTLARQMNIPCMVGVSGIYDLVKNGQALEVDADHGRVRFIDQ